MEDFYLTLGNDFKKDFNTLLKETDQKNFESSFKDLIEDYKTKLKTNLNMSEEELDYFEDYLNLLYEKKERWACCYTHLTFNAGNIFSRISLIMIRLQ